MTVVNFLRLNKKSGMACADERETLADTRVYDVARKIYNLPKCLIGYAGSVPNSQAVHQEIKDKIKSDSSPRQILNEIQDSYKEIKDKSFQRGVLDAYNIKLEEFPRLVIEKPEHFLVKQAGHEAGAKSFSVHVLVGLQEEDDFRLYFVGYPGVAAQLERYWSIGSGSDRANIVLGDAFNKMQPEDREDIHIATGARILMEATRSAWRNVGVGGRSQLCWLIDGKYTELEPQESNFLNNCLCFEEKGLLEKPLVNRFLVDIVERGAKAKEQLPELEKKLEHKKLVEQVLLDSLQY